MDASSRLSESDVLVVADVSQSDDSLDDGSGFPCFEKLVDDGLERGSVVEELGSIPRRGDTGNG